MGLKFANITEDDIEGVLRVQRSSYSTEYLEDGESFLSKINISPSTCYGVYDKNRLVAYGVSFPWFKKGKRRSKLHIRG